MSTNIERCIRALDALVDEAEVRLEMRIWRDEHEGEETYDEEADLWRRVPCPQEMLDRLHAAEKKIRAAVEEEVEERRVAYEGR